MDLLNFRGVTSAGIAAKIYATLNEKLETIVIHVGTNDLTTDVNLQSTVKKIVIETSKVTLSFINGVFRKDKRNTEKARADAKCRLKNFCRQKSINLLSNENKKTEHMGIKNFT